MGSNCRTCGWSEADEEFCGPEPPCTGCAALEAENAGLKRDMAEIRRCALLPPSKPEILSCLASLRRIDAICEDAGVEPALWDNDSDEYKEFRAHAIRVMKLDAARRTALEAK